MKKTSYLPLHKKLTLILPILAVLIAAAYVLALKFDFDFGISHFSTDSLGFIIFVASSVIAILLAAVSTLACPKQMTLCPLPESGPVSLFGAILAVIVSVAVFITELGGARESVKAAKETVGKVQPVLYMQLIGCVTVLAVGAVVALYCIGSQRGKAAHRIVSIIAPLSINLTMFARYFDFTEPLNGPVRNITIVVHCAVLLFLLSEARLAFSDRITARFCIFSSSVAASVGLGFSLGGVLFKIIDMSTVVPGESFIRLALYVALGCVAVDRLIALPKVLAELPAAESEPENENK